MTKNYSASDSENDLFITQNTFINDNYYLDISENDQFLFHAAQCLQTIMLDFYKQFHLTRLFSRSYTVHLLLTSLLLFWLYCSNISSSAFNRFLESTKYI